MTIDISYCGEYGHIIAYAKPLAPAGLLIIQRTNGHSEHMLRVSDLPAYLAQSSNIQSAQLMDVICAHLKTPGATIGDYVIEYITGVTYVTGISSDLS